MIYDICVLRKEFLIMELNQRIANNIKHLRQKASISQIKLAAFLDVSVPCLSYYETGKRNIPLEHLLSLAHFFNVTIDALCSNSVITLDDTQEIFFENFTKGSSEVYLDGEVCISNPYSMYFTMADTNGDTLVFLRCSEACAGLLLVGYNKQLFTTTISTVDSNDGKKQILTYTDQNGKTLVLRNKQMFLYYGCLVARISHIAKTEEFFAKK